MKYLSSNKKYVKAGMSIFLVCTLMLASVPSLTGYSSETREEWVMMIESIVVGPGTDGHVLEINGTWAKDIVLYSIAVQYDPQEMIDVVELNAEGCVGESGTWYPQYYDGHFRFSAVMETPIPAGSGKLVNLVFNASDIEGIVLLTFKSGSTTYYTDIDDESHHDIEFINGAITIGEENTPPGITSIEGPSSAYVNTDLPFSFVAEDPEEQDLTYFINWGDDTTGEFGPLASGESFNLTHKWTEPGKYEITAYAVDTFLAKGPNGTHSIEILGYPKLDITSISGGLGISFNLSNTGKGVATTVEWSATISGGLLGRINVTLTDTLAALSVGETQLVETGIVTFLGLGPVDITIDVSCQEDKSADETAEGFQILFFTFINEEI